MPTVDIGTLRARIAMDASQFSQAIGESEAETLQLRNTVTRLRPEIAKVEREIAKNGDETGELAIRLRRLREEYTKANTALASSRERTRRLTREMRQAGNAARQTGRDFQRAGSQLTNFGYVARDLISLVGAVGIVGTVNLAGRAVRSLAQGFTEATDRMVQLSGAASRVGVAPTDLLALQNLVSSVGLDAENAALALNELGVRTQDFLVLGQGTFPDAIALVGDLELEGRNLLDVFSELVDRTRELSPAQRAFALDAALGGEAAEKVNLVLGSLNGSFQDNIAAVRERITLTDELVEALAREGRELSLLRAEIEDRQAVAAANARVALSGMAEAWANVKIAALEAASAIGEASQDIDRETSPVFLTFEENLARTANEASGLAERMREIGERQLENFRRANEEDKRRRMAEEEAIERARELAIERAKAELVSIRTPARLEFGFDAVVPDAVEMLGQLEDALAFGGPEGPSLFDRANESIRETADGLRDFFVPGVVNAQETIAKFVEEQRILQENTDRLRDSIADSFTDAIFDGEGFLDVLDNIGRELLKLATNTAIRNLLSGAGFGTQGRSGLLGLGGVFGFLQEGGPALAGRPYVVGERGPELFVPSTSGTVVPHGEFGRTVTVVLQPDATQTDARLDTWLQRRLPDIQRAVSNA